MMEMRRISRYIFGTHWYQIKEEDMATSAEALSSQAGTDVSPVRVRILDAAFAAFSAHGYPQTSMLEIATRARVSKRELYTLVGNKHDMLVACIAERANRMPQPADMPGPRDRESLADVLVTFGERLLREVSDPVVLGVFRLAITEAERAPEIAQALDSIGRRTARRNLKTVLKSAKARGLLRGNPAQLATRFLALLWGDLLVDLLLRLTDQPTPKEIERRAHEATSAFLRLYQTEGSVDRPD